jgi:tRNA/tmRNA/rRNA uracil-C5-methylase (TrmA/RlmC/RlmD family)
MRETTGGFSEILRRGFDAARCQVQEGPGAHIEPLAHLTYEAEVRLKNAALGEFWRVNGLGGRPENLIPSPMPRNYRTTTKRRVVHHGTLISLAMGEKDGLRIPAGFTSRLEPQEHHRIYDAVRHAAKSPTFRPLANALNFVAVRGTYDAFCVILNVKKLDAAIVRRLKGLADQLKASELKVLSCIAFVGPADSRFYLDNAAPSTGSVKTKTLFGPDFIRATFDGVRYHYSPAVFCQINHSLVPRLLSTARDLLAPSMEHHLIDLYCGYGLFTRFLAPDCAHAAGVESDSLAISFAQGNCEHAGVGDQVRLRVCRIDAASLPQHLPRRGCHEELVLLDPPRLGCAPGVIELLAQREPARVLHLFCGMEEIPRHLREWYASAYHVSRVVPLDMFPGTPNLEVAVLLGPDAA